MNAVVHDHGGSSVALVGATGALATVACTVCAAVAAFHLRRLTTAAAGRKLFPISVEAGHLAVAAGMAVMFAAPHALAAPGFTWAYLGVALVFLALIVAHPHSGRPPYWWCHSMLFIEALAMACMSGAGGWWGADLAGWFTAVFFAAGLVAAGRIVLRRTPFAGAGGVSGAGTGTGSLQISAGSQLAMAAGMLLMLL